MTSRIKAPRLLVLCDRFPAPSETFIADHLSLMAAAGWDVALTARVTDLKRAKFPEGILFLPWPRSSFRSVLHALGGIVRNPILAASSIGRRCALQGARLAESEASRLEWDVVHAHFGNNGISALVANPEWKDRLVVNFHGHDATSMPTQSGWGLFRVYLSKCTKVAHSGFIEQILRSNIPGPVARVTMGVDIGKFSPPAKAATWAAPLKLLCVGRLSQQKGQIEAIECLRWLRRHRPELDARLKIIGDGPERDTLRELAAASDIAGHVDGIAPYPYDALVAEFRRADILLQPSQRGRNGWQEAFCRSAVEGMACGLPVVACPSGGLGATVGSGGVVVPGFDGETLGGGVLQVLDLAGPGQWARMSRARAEKFDLEAMAADYLAVAHSIMKGKIADGP